MRPEHGSASAGSAAGAPRRCVVTGRSADDFAHERGTLDAAYAQNETGRDSFAALAHTALFASSVAFVGDVTPLEDAVWRPALIAGWSASVIGLLALTSSFTVARRAIDARRRALNDADPPRSPLLEVLNAVSLWSFPISLLCLFSFVTANVVSADEPSSKSPVSPRSSVAAVTPGRGDRSAAARADPRTCPAPAGAVPSVDPHPRQFAAAQGAEPRRSRRRDPGRGHAGAPRSDADAARAAAPSAPADGGMRPPERTGRRCR